MNLGGSQAYAINAQMKKERVGNAHKYVPSLEITLPNKDPYTASGMFMYNGNRQFDVELMTNRITQKPIKTTGKYWEIYHISWVMRQRYSISRLTPNILFSLMKFWFEIRFSLLKQSQISRFVL